MGVAVLVVVIVRVVGTVGVGVRAAVGLGVLDASVTVMLAGEQLVGRAHARTRLPDRGCSLQPCWACSC